ncbi:MAG: ferrochelatase [Deltaproteobacteria bacterium]|nr:ferrochelatase [Deltaproteobacteria bacterium]
MRQGTRARAGRPNQGVLLINLGTPDSASVPDVRRYLREFLSDPRVLDMNAVGRWLLLNFVILPRRPAASARAYREIFGPNGSPLLANGLLLRDALNDRFSREGIVVELGMRYGNPSIREALEKLLAADVERIFVVPLFPQYSSAATGSAVEAVYRAAGQLWNVPALTIMPEFYDDPGFIEAFTEVARPVIESIDADHVLLSYHGLPERQVAKSDRSGAHCLKADDCCQSVGAANRHCYRAQCYATSRAVADALGLAPDSWSVSFQSRLGRIPWIKPYTDEHLPELARRGVKRLAVMSPAFVADCLETLEEIAIRAKDQWLALGGESLALVPSLNAHPAWVKAVAAWVRRTYPPPTTA